MNELWIDGQQMELPPGTDVAFTFATQDLTDPTNIEGDGSNRFSIPKTAGNMVKIEHADDVNSTTLKPYKKLPARYVQRGEEIVVGHAIIEEVNENIEMEVFSGNKDFFAEIEGKYMKDLDLSVWNHVWDTATVIGTRTNAAGFVYVIVNYHADNNAAQPQVNNRTVDVRYLFPTAFVHTLLRQIALEANYTFTGPIWNDTEMLNMLMLSGTLVHNDGWQALRQFNLTKATDQFWSKGSAPTGWVEAVNFPPQNDYDGFWWGATDSVYATFEASGVIGFLNGQFDQLIIDITSPDGAGVIVSQTLTLSPVEATLVNGGIPVNKTFSLSTGQVQVLAGDHMYVRITYLNTATPSGSQFGDYCVYAGAKFSNTVSTEYSFGGNVEMTDVMPVMSQKDFVKGIIQDLAIIPVTDARTRTMYWGSLAEVHANKVRAKNMTKKVDAVNRSVRFRFGEFARFNKMKWKADATVPAFLGEGSIFINDFTLEEEKDLITLPFAATETEERLQGLTVPRVKKLELGREKNKTEPRLVMLDRQNVLISAPIVYIDGNGTHPEWNQIPICYFSWAAKPYNLDFFNSIPRRRAEWLLLLDKAKALSVTAALTEQDIATREPLVPWYLDQEQAYFWVNNIEDFTDGDTTEVELFRL